jgi:hypothetical protein
MKNVSSIKLYKQNGMVYISVHPSLIENYLNYDLLSGMTVYDGTKNKIPHIIVVSKSEGDALQSEYGDFGLYLANAYPNITPFTKNYAPKDAELNFASYDIVSLCKYEDDSYTEYFLDIISFKLYEYRQQLGLEPKLNYFCTLAHTGDDRKSIVRSPSLSIELNVEDWERQEAISTL